jgi:DNA primase large subunit
LGKDFSKEQFQGKKSGLLKLANLDQVAKNHFPPCMRNLYDSLKKENHLK